jgi:hypothetical protein
VTASPGRAGQRARHRTTAPGVRRPGGHR